MQRTLERIATERLVLRTWQREDLSEFARMHADPVVMRDLGGPISTEESRVKLLRYISMYEVFGFSRYCVEDRAGEFVGYVGVCPRREDQVIGSHNEIGWRLNYAQWGKGYATEAAQACIAEFRRAFPDTEIISYTSALNMRSQNVMARLNLVRAPSRDFEMRKTSGRRTPLLVWVVG